MTPANPPPTPDEAPETPRRPDTKAEHAANRAEPLQPPEGTGAGADAHGGVVTEGRSSAAAEEARRLLEAARELAEVAHTLREVAERVTGVLVDPGVAAGRSPRAGLRARRAVLRAVTNGRGLGWAVAGGVVGTFGAKLGGLVHAGNLPIRVMTTSLRLRIAAVVLRHPELTGDPLLRRLLDAVGADGDLAAGRALYALVKDRGAARALSGVAPIFGELLALRALLDKNPLNDRTAWLIATGMGTATADPLTGMSNRAVARLDRGRGAAVRTEPKPHEAERLSARGSFLDFLNDLLVIRPSGRALVQTVRGPDGVERHVVLAPGMRIGSPQAEHPADLLGAFSSTVLDSGPYSRSLAAAIADYGVPEGAEVAFVGHSAGGSAVMSLAQDEAFNARHVLTDVVSIGAPVDFKEPAAQSTRVASVTNQHDIIPTLDGQGAGTCFTLHPDWYVVDYTDPTHLFPACHGLEQYAANLRDDLPEARAHLQEQLARYDGPVLRRQLYRLLDEAPEPTGFPFLTVPTHRVDGPAGPVTVPVLSADAALVTAWFAVPAAEAAAQLAGTPFVPVTAGSRALAALCLTDHRAGSLAPHREATLSLLVHSPLRPRLAALCRDALRPAPLRHAGLYPLASTVSTPEALDAAALWPHPTHLSETTFTLTPSTLTFSALHEDTILFTFTGPLGPRFLSPRPRLSPIPYYSSPATPPTPSAYAAPRAIGPHRSVHHRLLRAPALHPAPRLRLHTGPPTHPFTALLHALSLTRSRPLTVHASPTTHLRRDPPTPLTPPPDP
ncbi:hypothetical protein LO762_10430 [Actinocorallia sp. API 0066]|uniref:hypothetical protein n=1 Tax=Actinocorallia sp. API 0066 TaxID=2896846 RepID=UPI001E4AA406|nr:hypothetical protein [Actinocorallia sp. API 0066]MCD0449603.1 hypothetical protein [Actinocorallia sp. API 0066]